MHRARAACLWFLALVMTMPASLRAEEEDAAAAESPTMREFHVEHVDVKEANAIVRSLLDIRKSAIDVRRQVIILSDTPAKLEQAAKLLAQVDAAVSEWSVSLVALLDGKETMLRTASITQGHLDVRFGPSPVTTEGNLGVTAAITRAASGEVDLKGTTSLTMPGQWTESAQALETLHDDATVTLVKTTDPVRQKALGNLLGVPSLVDALVIKIAKVGSPAQAKGAPTR